MIAVRSKPCSALSCATMSDTRLHCRSENRSLKVVVSGSLASSTMLPTELAVSESVSDIFVDVAVTKFLVGNLEIEEKMSNGLCCSVKLTMVGEGSAVSACVCGRDCGVGSLRLPYLQSFFTRHPSFHPRSPTRISSPSHLDHLPSATYGSSHQCFDSVGSIYLWSVLQTCPSRVVPSKPDYIHNWYGRGAATSIILLFRVGRRI